MCILSYLVTKWDTFLCFTSLLIRFLYSILSSPSPSLLLSSVTKLKFCVTGSSLFHTYISPEMQAKTNRFITALMTAGCMLSEFLNSTKLLFLPKHVELQQSTFYWDRYLQMKNDSAGKNYLVSAIDLFLASCLVKLQKI